MEESQKREKLLQNLFSAVQAAADFGKRPARKVPVQKRHEDKLPSTILEANSHTADRLTADASIAKRYYQVLKHAAQPQLPRDLGFLDLPPEIRNLIYSCMLWTEELPIRIDAIWTSKGAWASRLAYAEAKINGVHQYAPKIPPVQAGIALTCKQLTAETLPMIYALNTFEFCNLNELDLFLRVIGDARKHLCRLRIANYRPWVFGEGRQPRYVFEQLAEATQLQSLTVNFSHLFISRSTFDPRTNKPGGDHIAEFLSDVKPLLKAVGPSRAPKLIKAIAASPCSGCDRRLGIKSRAAEDLDFLGNTHSKYEAPEPRSGTEETEQMANLEDVLEDLIAAVL